MAENLQSFLVPGKLYFNQGCLPIALRELKYELDKKRILIITDAAMLQDDGLFPVTRSLYELGITYSVISTGGSTLSSCRKFEPDCIVACGSADALEVAAGVREGYDATVYFITIPTTLGKTQTAARPDMVIVDEDLVAEPDASTASAILHTARESLRGVNASDYTLGFAVQAISIILNGATDKTSLMRAASLAENALTIAYAGGKGSADLIQDAADALGMTADALEAKLS
ncbi:MAG: iron-containing alcohol dehydrogenase [Oscillospiraceae bacterium]|nr:iron-containing alcohol dehydrogenase [Oscillospiraceae bacterium]